jgi:hypothetical protein
MISRSDRQDVKLGPHVPYLLSLTVLAVIAASLTTASRGLDFDLPTVAALTVAFFAARLLTIRLPQGDDVYVTLVVGLTALAIADVWTVLLASAAAGGAESVARFSQSSRAATVHRVIDIFRGTAVIGVVSPCQLILQPLVRSADRQGEMLILWVLVTGAVYAGLDIVTMAIQHRIDGGLRTAEGIAALQRPLSTVYLVHLPMAAVSVRLYAASGIWAFPVALLLTLILQNSFNLYLRIRRGYADTISVLAHAAELDRPHDSGHARRVADLSVAVGRKMGLSSQELERIGYAALLHDIGRMGDVGEDSRGIHAQRGAEIVGSVPFLKDVAPLIDAPEAGDVPGQPVGAEIVRMCSRYDRLRGEVGARAAMDALILEAGGLHGRVLEALNAIIQGQMAKAGGTR